MEFFFLLLSQENILLSIRSSFDFRIRKSIYFQISQVKLGTLVNTTFNFQLFQVSVVAKCSVNRGRFLVTAPEDTKSENVDMSNKESCKK